MWVVLPSLRSVTRADVEVQPYAFTTKSLYVGHFDYKYLRFQAIDTPGILDRPTEEMNNIEMQSIYAIAHIRSCVLYFMDLSEQCGFSVEDQVKLFHSIKPLFANKSVLVVINKIDVVRPEDLDDERKELLQSITKIPDVSVEIMQLSCHTEEGIMEVRNKAVDRLRTARIEQKLKSSNRMAGILNKIHVARPAARDDISTDALPSPRLSRPSRNTMLTILSVASCRVMLRLRTAVLVSTSPITRMHTFLMMTSGKQYIMPEILDGKNVYDFLDPEISAKLAALEAEEERLEQEGFYESEEEIEDEEEEGVDKEKAAWIRNRQQMIKNKARTNKSLKNRAQIPIKKVTRTVESMESHMSDIGIDTSRLTAKAHANASGPVSSSGLGHLSWPRMLLLRGIPPE